MSKSKLTLGSLFDGSGGFPLGGLMCGIKPIWASEIEPFAIRITTKRLPFMKHLGDINEINGSQIDPVDIITFGSPCQDMSIAGKREGLSGSRLSLFYQAIRVIKEMRRKTNGKYPRYCLWKNVPGALSSNKGEDFKNVLESICQIKEDVSVPKPEKWSNAEKIVGDNFSLAWRVLDARHFGVPQANTRGGIIYIGVDDKGETYPIGDIDKILQKLTNAIRDSICPDVTFFAKYDVLENKVVKITINEGNNKPYFLKEKGLTPAGVYVSQGSSSA